MRLRAVLVAALTSLTLAVPAVTARAAPQSLPAGCTTNPRAVTFRSGDSAGAPSTVPVCVLSTGFAAAETHIRVSSDGTVVEEPAIVTEGVAGTGFVQGTAGPKPETQLSVAGLAVSANQGAAWDFVKPGGATWVAQDASIHIDRVTGRLYYYGLTSSPAPQGGDLPLTEQVPSVYAHLLSTKDGGKTWNSVSLPGFVNAENPRFTTGPAPTTVGAPQPVPGEQIAYWCGNNMLFTMVARICFRSLDGGVTWAQRSILFTQGAPQHPECGSNGEDFGALDGNYPQAAADGTLWVMVSCGGTVYLARSTDEGATWPILRNANGDPLAIPAAEELRVDRAGNLYSAHLNGSALELRVSRDGGRTWSAPLDMTAPAMRSATIHQWAFAVGSTGQVATSLLASRPDGGSDGVITVTGNALDPNPTFVSSPVNPATSPLVSSSQEAKDDFIDIDIGPDGSAWAAYYADCASGSADPACADAGGSTDPLRKMTTIGRLVVKRGSA